MKTLKRGARHAKQGVGVNMQRPLDVFHSLKAERSAALEAQHGLIIKVGEGLGADILKLLKPSWTTDDPREILNTNGLFFSVWVDDACKAGGIVRYNLHAKKLRFIKGETFAAREFARAFRAQSKDELEGWPNWSYPKGPITLFEGHFELDDATLRLETSALMDRFITLTPTLDRLLAE
jgi:hypothetical protein